MRAVIPRAASSSPTPFSPASFRTRPARRSVLIEPGLMALTRTPSRTPRSARHLVRLSRAALTEPPMVNSVTSATFPESCRSIRPPERAVTANSRPRPGRHQRRPGRNPWAEAVRVSGSWPPHARRCAGGGMIRGRGNPAARVLALQLAPQRLDLAQDVLQLLLEAVEAGAEWRGGGPAPRGGAPPPTPPHPPPPGAPPAAPRGGPPLPGGAGGGPGPPRA